MIRIIKIHSGKRPDSRERTHRLVSTSAHPREINIFENDVTPDSGRHEENGGAALEDFVDVGDLDFVKVRGASSEITHCERSGIEEDRSGSTAYRMGCHISPHCEALFAGNFNQATVAVRPESRGTCLAKIQGILIRPHDNRTGITESRVSSKNNLTSDGGEVRFPDTKVITTLKFTSNPEAAALTGTVHRHRSHSVKFHFRTRNLNSTTGSKTGRRIDGAGDPRACFGINLNHTALIDSRRIDHRGPCRRHGVSNDRDISSVHSA